MWTQLMKLNETTNSILKVKFFLKTYINLPAQLLHHKEEKQNAI
jgi:hypothetical protein